MPANAAEERSARECITSSEPAGRSRRSPATRVVLSTYVHSLVRLGGWRFLGVVSLMTLTSLTEGAGVALLFPVLAVAGFNMAGQGHVGHYTAEVQDLLASSGLGRELWLPTLLILFLLLMTVRSLLLRIQSVWTLDTVLRYEVALSSRLYRAIVEAEWRFLAGRRLSDLTHVLTAEMARVSAAVYQSLAALSSLILAIVYAVIAFKLSTVTTLMVLGAGAALLLFNRRWLRRTHESGEALSETMSAVYSAATDHLGNLRTIKTYGAAQSSAARFGLLERSAMEQSLRSARSQSAAAFWFEAGSLVVLAGIVFVSLRYLGVGSASILLLLAIFTRLMPQLASGNTQAQAFFADLPAFENVMRLTTLCEEHAEADDGVCRPEVPPRSHDRSRAAASGLPLNQTILNQAIKVEDVSFRYSDGLPLVLDHLSMTLKAGEISAIVGPSGAGKSTVADLINGLQEPASGRILIDDLELNRSSIAAWRGRIGYVAQDTVLFHDTIRANLLWSQPDASEEEVDEALHLAAAGFVSDLPLGLETLVGDRGVLLSNGQRQRLALARALLRKPSLLILDEATNSLDVENEKRILDSIERLKGRTTVLLIAHRATVVERADKIYLLDHGRASVVENWNDVHPEHTSSEVFSA